MSRSLYELTQDFNRLRELADMMEDEESRVDIEAAMDSALLILEGDLSDKMDNCSALIAEWKSEQEMFDKEIKRLQGRKKVLENNVSRLKERMLHALKETDTKKTKGVFCVSQRKPTASVVIDDIDSVPQSFIKIEKKVDKAAIKKTWKEAAVPGCHLDYKEGVGIR